MTRLTLSLIRNMVLNIQKLTCCWSSFLEPMLISGSHSLYLSDKVFEENSFCESWYNWRYRYRNIVIRALWLIHFWQRDDSAIFNCWGTTPHRSEVLIMFNVGSAEECAFSDQTQNGIPSGPMLVLLILRMPSNTCRTFIGTL